jgi:hypothetical protein
MVRFLRVVPILLLSCTAWAAESRPAVCVPNEVPRSWSRKEIHEAALPPASGAAYVLAWQIVEDERPLRVESCLVLTLTKNEKGKQVWCLTHLYRHPAEEKPRWRLSMSHLTGAKGTKYWPGLWLWHYKQFNSRPSNKEVYAALSPEEVNWSFTLDTGWRYVSCGVCEKTWQAALGEKPTRFFGR